MEQKQIVDTSLRELRRHGSDDFQLEFTGMTFQSLSMDKLHGTGMMRFSLITL